MNSFGVVYIHSGGIWEDMQKFSQMTLPKNTPVEIILCDNHIDSLSKRLDLVNNLPFKNTLYIDVDVIYCSHKFPDWIFNPNLVTGVGMSAWYVANQPWMWPASWARYFNIDEVKNLPHWFRWPNGGLMFINKYSKGFFDHWKNIWGEKGLIEPSFIKAYSKNGKLPFDIIDTNFHIPSYAIINDNYKLDNYFFIHAICPPESKLEEMSRLFNLLTSK